MSNQHGVGLHYYQNYHNHQQKTPVDYNKIEVYPYIEQHHNHHFHKNPPIELPPSQNRQIIEDYPSDRGNARDSSSTKRDKKWSFSNLFRRKKKDQTTHLSNSSSEDDLLKNKQRSRSKKSNRTSKTSQRGTFDHIVVQKSTQNTPTVPFVSHQNQTTYRVSPEDQVDHAYYQHNGQKAPTHKVSCGNSCESLQSSTKRLNTSSPFSRHSCNSSISNSNPSNMNSLDSSSSFGRKSRRELVKARVEARRDHLKTESSSEDEERSSQVSASSSSATKHPLGSQRSDDGLGVPRSRDSSASRKSRSARTERFHSRRSSKESLNGHSASKENQHAQPYFQNYYSPPSLAVTDYVQPEPPPPPPRDPQRRLVIVGQVGENGRPVSYSFENETQEPPRVRSIKENCPSLSTTSIQSYNSDLGIPYTNPNLREPTTFRSNSVNSEPIRRYIRRHPVTNGSAVGGDKFNYFADQLPRSRKPIMIQSSNLPENKYLSDSQIVNSARNSNFYAKRNHFEQKSAPQNNPDMFKVQVTKEEDGMISTLALKNGSTFRTSPARSSAKPVLTYSKSEEKEIRPMFSGRTTQSFNNGGKPKELAYSKSTEEKTELPTHTERRSSSNLEDALSELEAIYKSLRLGDEDLLDRAEQQEIQSRLQSQTAEGLKKLSGSMSDSGFEFDYHQDRSRFKRSLQKKLPDDMAERKLQQIPAVAELEKGLTQISYLLASPVHNSIDAFCAVPQKDEPDITLDDVVFRNIKHINNSLKVVEPQPPFGIPLGPISTAANSDYLHAVPIKEKPRNAFKPSRIPDVVKDDLAYRTLRKDGSKELGLPSALTADDYINNNNSKFCSVFSANAPLNKKNRAVRSLSANIYNLLHGSFEENTNEFESTFRQMEKSKSITDINEDLSRKTAKNDVPNKLHQKIQVYIPLYDTDVVVNKKPPSGLLQNAKRANLSPSPVPCASRSSLTSPILVETVKETMENKKQMPAKETIPPSPTRTKQEETIEIVAEHAKLCEKLLECVIESTELIAPKKAVTEYVPDEEELVEEALEDLEEIVEKIVPPIVKANVTESAENQMATLDVEPITLEMLSETDEHDYENLPENAEEKCLAVRKENLLEHIDEEDNSLGESSENTITPVPLEFRDVPEILKIHVTKQATPENDLKSVNRQQKVEKIENSETNDMEEELATAEIDERLPEGVQ